MPQSGKVGADTGAPLVVVGGGVIGLACALECARGGTEVTLLDEAATTPPASWGNAGHIATEQVEPIASPKALRSAFARLYCRGGALAFRPADIATWLPWSLRYLNACAPARYARGRQVLGALLADALPAWQRLAVRLGEAALVEDAGHVVVWESRASAARGLAAWSATDTGTARMEPLDAQALASLGARLRVALHGGIRFVHTGQVASPGLVLERLRSAFGRAGGTLLRGHVAGLRPVAGGIALALSTGETVTAPRVLVAAGVGSRGLLQAAGHRTPLIAERGYHIEGTHSGWDDLPPVVFEDRSMIVTRFGERLRAASFVEFGRAGAPADPGKWARLERHVDELGVPLHGGVPWMGCRPTLPDYLPAIGVSRRLPGLAYAFGHQHLGLTLAATTAELVAERLSGARTRIDLAPLDIERYA